MNQRAMIPAGAAAVLMGAALWSMAAWKAKVFAEVTVHTQKAAYHLRAEVADTDEKKRRGLMGRRALAEGEGMLFPYVKNVSPAFWMKNMKLPLDILFIRADGVIADVANNVPPCPETTVTCPLYFPQEPVRTVLEVNTEFTEWSGVKAGDTVTFPAF